MIKSLSDSSRKLMLRFSGFFTLAFAGLLIEIALIALLLYVFAVPYLAAVALAFLLVNIGMYLPMRHTAFFGTTREFSRGYIYYFIIAIGGLMLTITGSYLAVSLLLINPIVARFFLGGISGLWNFYMNLRFNFRVT